MKENIDSLIHGLSLIVKKLPFTMGINEKSRQSTPSSENWWNTYIISFFSGFLWVLSIASLPNVSMF